MKDSLLSVLIDHSARLLCGLPVQRRMSLPRGRGGSNLRRTLWLPYHLGMYSTLRKNDRSIRTVPKRGPRPPPDLVPASQNPGGLRGEAEDRPSDTRGGRTPPLRASLSLVPFYFVRSAVEPPFGRMDGVSGLELDKRAAAPSRRQACGDPPGNPTHRESGAHPPRSTTSRPLG